MNTTAQVDPEASTADAASNRLWELEWKIQLSGLYHARRERFLDGCDKWAKFVAAIGGAAAFAQFKGDSNIGAWISAFISVISTLSLVFGFSTKARKHYDLARDFKKLEAELAALGRDVTDMQLDEFKKRYLLVETGEPSSLSALVTDCHNQLCKAHGIEDRIAPLPFYQNWLMNFLDFDQSDVKPISEKKSKSCWF
mgnify:CR=1 FL=1